MPRLISRWFGDGGSQWARMARVLVASATRHCPGWSIDIAAFQPPPVGVPCAIAAYRENSQKLDAWADLVEQAPSDERIVLMDTDTMVLGPLEAAWLQPFDVAITVRPASFSLPINAGVIFLRATPAAKAFLRAWQRENRRMLEDPEHHRAFRKQYGGINQAALGALLNRQRDASVACLPCQVWNCEDSGWPTFSGETRILHVKSDLRRAIFHQAQVSPKLLLLVHLWRQADREAMKAESREARPQPGRVQVFGRRAG